MIEPQLREAPANLYLSVTIFRYFFILTDSSSDLVLGVILILLELVLEVLELSLGLVLLIFSSNFFWVQQLVILLISCQFAQFFF